MTDVETIVRTQLHDRLDELEPSPLTMQRAVSRGQRARRRRTALVAAAAAAVLSAAGASAVSMTRGDGHHEAVIAANGVEERTVTYAEQFRAGDFASIRSDMTPATRDVLTEATLRAGWQQVVAAYGSPAGVGDPSVTDDGGTTVLVPLQFTRGAVDLRVTYDDRRRVIGVTLLRAGLKELPTEAAALETEAREVVAAMAGGRFAEVYARFDDRMKEALPAAGLRRAWTTVAVTEHGGFVAAGGTTARQISGHTVVDVFCTMRKGELKVRVAFDGRGRVAGLYLLEP